MGATKRYFGGCWGGSGITEERESNRECWGKLVRIENECQVPSGRTHYCYARAGVETGGWAPWAVMGEMECGSC